MKGIKAKLIIYFSTLIVIGSCVLGIFVSIGARDAIITEAEIGLDAFSNEAAISTQAKVDIQIESLAVLAGTENVQSMDWENQRPELMKQVENGHFITLAIVNPDGEAHFVDGSTLQVGEENYVKSAFNGEANVSDLIVDEATKELTLMFSAPIERDGRIVGVLIGQRDGNTLSEIAEAIVYGENGYGFIVNTNGTVVGHPNREFVSEQFTPIEAAKNDSEVQSLGDLVNNMIKEKGGVGKYSFNGKDLYTGYATIEGTEWILGINADVEEVQSAIPTLLRNIVIVTIIILAVSIVIAYFIGNAITHPIISIIGHSKKIADLNLTENVPEALLKKKDEIGALSIALQTITDSLKEVISGISQSAEQVSASSEELTATSQTSAAASEEIAHAVQGIASGASEQARNTEEGSNKANILGELIENDQSYVKEVNSASQRVNKAVEEGLMEIQNLTNISSETSEATGKVHQGILKTNDSANKIGEASSVIANIAEQTNLLALNAAIEAARAGESGKGFSVVAEEIRKLAEQSANSTKYIANIVKELQNNSKSSVEIMESVSSILGKQEESMNVSKVKYTAINEAMKIAGKAVEKLNASSEETEKMKDEIFDALQNLAAIAQENAASTEEVSASIEEQSASMEEISRASEDLSNLAQNLQSIVMKFDV
ncbi:methyl-accepting chemotaxis protein [Oceanobacillus chungangensis]|uniref:methyl-accepting chemotaxis protein n=1 Tax=Oceanobacillus chungangensis TaxID=1229152 RepID=UPI001B85F40A|nr:methyl-accepting chemotaxis protein [Oceanobacillus chungangensis]